MMLKSVDEGPQGACHHMASARPEKSGASSQVHRIIPTRRKELCVRMCPQSNVYTNTRDLPAPLPTRQIIHRRFASRWRGSRFRTSTQKRSLALSSPSLNVSAAKAPVPARCAATAALPRAVDARISLTHAMQSFRMSAAERPCAPRARDPAFRRAFVLNLSGMRSSNLRHASRA